MSYLALDLLIDNFFDSISRWYEGEVRNIKENDPLRFSKRYIYRSKRNEMEEELHQIVREFTSHTEKNPYQLDEGLGEDDRERLMDALYEFYLRCKDISCPYEEGPDYDFFIPLEF